jgi:hypothetical protein
VISFYDLAHTSGKQRRGFFSSVLYNEQIIGTFSSNVGFLSVTNGKCEFVVDPVGQACVLAAIDTLGIIAPSERM